MLSSNGTNSISLAEQLLEYIVHSNAKQNFRMPISSSLNRDALIIHEQTVERTIVRVLFRRRLTLLSYMHCMCNQTHVSDIVHPLLINTYKKNFINVYGLGLLNLLVFLPRRSKTQSMYCTYNAMSDYNKYSVWQLNKSY